LVAVAVAVVHTTMLLQVVVVLDMFTLIRRKVFQGKLLLQSVLAVREELVYR
jgi:hypothetical protein